MLIAAKRKSHILYLKKLLSREFDMNDLGSAKKILGMEIHRDKKAGKFWVTQKNYVEKVLERFSMLNDKPVSTPLGAHFQLSSQLCPSTKEDVEYISRVPYTNAVGCLMYAMVCTRPNISHAVSMVSRYMGNLGKKHWDTVKWIFRYLAGSTNFGIMFDRDGAKGEVSGFVDSNYAEDLDSMRSMTGYVFTFYGGPIFWKSVLQSTTALSTTEAEYMALTEAAKEALWLKGLVEELGFKQRGLLLQCDSQNALDLAKNQVFHARTKHIDVQRFCNINNSLYGTIPSNVGTSSSLNYLDLSVNRFSGEIPSEISLLMNFTFFSMYDNQINGSIPHEIGKLRSLVELSMLINNLTGPIPASIGNLSKLTILSLYQNQLSGSIPQEVGMLKSLVRLDLLINDLTGSIPTSIGNLDNLTLLDLSVNHLTSPLPTLIGNLANLRILYLFENELSGRIPSIVGNLTKLIEFILNRNHLSGPIPAELGKLKSLTDLTLFTNKFTGSLPSELNNLTNLQTFQLSDNKFTGPLPDDVCLGGVLNYFAVVYNNFIGPVPKSLKNCTSLFRARLEINHLTGNIADAFVKIIFMLFDNWGLWHNLTSLKISNNNLVGTIPPGIGKRTQLSVLDLSSNHLVGEIPANLGNLVLLVDLFIDENRLIASIPPDIGNLSNLGRLNLAANNLSGGIPEELGKCTKLWSLNLSQNRLENGIPYETSKLWISKGWILVGIY
ncbi:LOW QUALITY PROTEIN: hypothetical protein RJ639_047752 [Escallonia herrerae]|uniref:Uncharacterized protein n=1 Tax=Escallonia herrerae TaxID=1293975 RepID=A0AA88W443_9ASTE|nr:LOW QUALITY PROTEIN: hypothetical protein RJ639_047752 [Escallonia herrerae]